MEFSTPPRSATPGKRLVIPHYEDSPRAFGGRGTLSHPAAPSTNAPERAALERRMPSARSFSPSYRSRTPLFAMRRPSVSRPNSSKRPSSTTVSEMETRQRPSTADNALRDVSRPIGVRPGTADRPGYRVMRKDPLPGRASPTKESTSYTKMEASSLKENSNAPRTYPTLGISRPNTSGKSKEKTTLQSATVPVGSLIKAKATSTLEVYKKGIIDVIKDFNSIKDEAERKEVLLKMLKGTSKELERHAKYTASVAAKDNPLKLKVITIGKELKRARGKSHDLYDFHFQLEFVKKRIENSVIQSK